MSFAGALSGFVLTLACAAFVLLYAWNAAGATIVALLFAIYLGVLIVVSVERPRARQGFPKSRGRR